jgi:colanic acid/amylovoran biosynthesis glycosyltransferase
VNLILFSASYPYVHGGESNFLNVEVKYLLKTFDRVVVIPEKCEGLLPADYAGAEVDVSYADALGSLGVLNLFQLAISSKIFRHGMLEKSFPRFSFSAWRRLIAFAGRAEFTRRWVLDWLRTQNLFGKDCIFYTYWFDHAAAGVGFAKEQFPDIRLVSRAHGYDLYEEQYYNPPFWPCRRSVLPFVDRIFPDSEAGTKYLSGRYPEFAAHYETSLLGVSDPGFVTHPSNDGVFRIVSCSMIRPEKRVERFFESILLAAQLRPKQKFEWYHFGNGTLREQLQKIANNKLPPNAKAHFPGYSDNVALMRSYREDPFDVFINVSETEGTPVSIMEALSCGIPVIATAVGGNTEIVSNENGILLSANPTVDEVVSTVFRFIDDPDMARAKRRGSRNVWQMKYNADRNFFAFAGKLRSIREMEL